MYDPNNPNMGGMQQGFADYLQGQGWDGQGPMWQYAHQLRQQGQHPRWDYRHPGQEWPGAGGLGGLASQWQGPAQGPQAPNWQGPHTGGQPPMWGGSYEAPHQPNLGMGVPNSGYDGSGINPGGGSYQQPQQGNGLAALSRRRPGGFIQS